MSTLDRHQALIRRFCVRDRLDTFDPYDIWQTPWGFRVKDFYNRHRLAGLFPAGLLTLFDVFVNDRRRWFYTPREYPIVRAWAALALLNLHEQSGDAGLVEAARRHLDWLCAHACPGYRHPCWGLGTPFAVSAGLVYDGNMPLTTMTPYPLEALVRYSRLTGDDRYAGVIRGVYGFLETDVQVLEETDEYLVTSYAAMRDRRVINAVSYVMYCYSLLLPYLEAAERPGVERKIRKLFAYVVLNQAADGSWFYSPEGGSFIDCFHSCIVLKNLIRTNEATPLPGCRDVVARGYGYLKASFLVPEAGLFKRFSISNKPSIVRFDLYDNAEMLNLSILMQDGELARSLEQRIAATFVGEGHVYSQTDLLGIRRRRDTLRWAVMPYLHALSMLGRASPGPAGL